MSASKHEERLDAAADADAELLITRNPAPDASPPSAPSPAAYVSIGPRTDALWVLRHIRKTFATLHLKSSMSDPAKNAIYECLGMIDELLRAPPDLVTPSSENRSQINKPLSELPMSASKHEELTKERIDLVRAWLDRRCLLDTDLQAVCDAAERSLQQWETLLDVLAEIENSKRVSRDPYSVTIVLARNSALETRIRRCAPVPTRLVTPSSENRTERNKIIEACAKVCDAERANAERDYQQAHDNCEDDADDFLAEAQMAAQLAAAIRKMKGGK